MAKISTACRAADHGECEEFDGTFWCECSCHAREEEPLADETPVLPALPTPFGIPEETLRWMAEAERERERQRAAERASLLADLLGPEMAYESPVTRSARILAALAIDEAALAGMSPQLRQRVEAASRHLFYAAQAEAWNGPWIVVRISPRRAVVTHLNQSRTETFDTSEPMTLYAAREEVAWRNAAWREEHAAKIQGRIMQARSES